VDRFPKAGAEKGTPLAARGKRAPPRAVGRGREKPQGKASAVELVPNLQTDEWFERQKDLAQSISHCPNVQKYPKIRIKEIRHYDRTNFAGLNKWFRPVLTGGRKRNRKRQILLYPITGVHSDRHVFALKRFERKSVAFSTAPKTNQKRGCEVRSRRYAAVMGTKKSRNTPSYLL
jgi:hypothetical protein